MTKRTCGAHVRSAGVDYHCGDNAGHNGRHRREGDAGHFVEWGDADIVKDGKARDDGSYAEQMAALEGALLGSTILYTNHNKTHAAARLGISRRHFQRRYDAVTKGRAK
jgi:DNA-binding NtrC family response regulator